MTQFHRTRAWRSRSKSQSHSEFFLRLRLTYLAKSSAVNSTSAMPQPVMGSTDPAASPNRTRPRATPARARPARGEASYLQEPIRRPIPPDWDQKSEFQVIETKGCVSCVSWCLHFD